MYRSNEKDDKKIPILPIGAVAKVLSVHQRTLRIYDEQEILVPKRSSTNKRLYTLEDVELGRFVLFLTRNLAINLAGVKIIMALIKKDKTLKVENYISRARAVSGLSDEQLAHNKERLAARGRKPAAKA